MIHLEISIRPTKSAQRPIAAWYIPGADPTQEIARWNLPSDQLQAIVVPISSADLRPRGVLVFSAEGQDLSNLKPIVHPRCVPFGTIADRLFLPITAELSPAASTQELPQLLNDRMKYVWHPSTGLTGIADNELCDISDFLSVEPESFADWNHAQAGIQINQRLHSIESIESTSFDEVLEESRDDIGDRSDEIERNHRAAIHRSSDQGYMETLRALGPSGAMSNGFAKMILWMTSKSPGTANSRTWINNLEDWAAAKTKQVSEKLFQKRNKELLRLIEMLKRDPDEGLKFALPLASLNEHRGLAVPSSQLTKNNLDFHLSGSRQGIPADLWDVPYQIQTQLTQHYRELAEREKRLGRFRRAAYIYAELLADLPATALTLEAGRHWREAAIVYRERLKQDDAAARCLKKGGMWTEAIALYLELGQIENAGDTYATIGQTERAFECYASAVNELFSRGNYLAAAKIEEQKLKVDDIALETLAKGWNSRQAIPCLEETLRILKKTGRHHDAQVRIQACRDRSFRADELASLVRLLATTAQDYPDRTTKLISADTTRWLISQALTDNPQANHSSLLHSVTHLNPEDRLLTRDVRRFSIQRFAPPPTPSARSAERKRQQIIRVRSIELEKREWITAVALEQSLLAVGQQDGKLYVQRMGWDGHGSLASQTSIPCKRPKFLIVEKGANPSFVATYEIGEPEIQQRLLFPESERYPSLTIGNVARLSGQLLGLESCSQGGWLQVRSHQSDLLLESFTKNEMVYSSCLVESFGDSSQEDGVTLPIPIHNTGSWIFVAVGKKLIEVQEDRKIATVFDQPILSIAGSQRGTRIRVAVGFEHGVQVFWDNANSESLTFCCPDFENPHLLFTRTGHLVVAAGDRCEVYSTRGNRLSFAGTVNIESPLALLQAEKSDEFGVLSDHGRVSIYKIP